MTSYLYAILDASRKEIVAEEFSQCNPPAMWAKLQSVHQQKKPSSRFIAYEVLLSSVLQDGESLPTFGARVSGAYRRVKELVPSTYTVEQMGEELTVMAIVRGMPFEQYGSFRSQLMMKDELSLSTLKELLQQEQANRDQGSAQQSALAAASSGAKLKCTSVTWMVTCRKTARGTLRPRRLQRTLLQRPRPCAVARSPPPRPTLLKLLLKRLLPLTLLLLLPLLLNLLEMQVTLPPPPSTLLFLTGMQTQAPLLT